MNPAYIFNIAAQEEQHGTMLICCKTYFIPFKITTPWSKTGVRFKFCIIWIWDGAKKAALIEG